MSGRGAAGTTKKGENMKTKLLATAALAVFGAPSVMAQDAIAGRDDASAQATQGIGDIVVTANRRVESVQKSSLAISVVGGAELAQAGVTQAADLASLVPGLTVSNGGATVQTYLRGVGSFATDASAESAIAYNINGVYISRPSGIGPIFFDLERVEVLKGPQGTLYGRNASGGAINLITRRPTQDVTGTVSVDLGNYDLRRVTMAVGGGVTDTFAVRAAAQWTKRGGYLSDGYNDQDSISTRLTALWTPVSNVSLLVTGEYSHQQGMGEAPVKRSSLTPVPSDHWQGPSAGNIQQPPTAFIPGGTRINDDGFQDIRVAAISAELNVDFGPATLTFIPAYRDTDTRYLTYTPGFYFDTHETSRQQSYELRLGHQSDALKWVAGLYYFNEDQTQFYVLHADPIQDGTVDSPIYTRSYAAFGEATYSITPSLRLIGGIRYSKDRKRQEGLSVAYLPAPGTTSNYGRLSDDEVTWKGGVEYDLSPRNMLFATASTGYKAGGFFPSVPAPNNSFKPEKLTAFTVGSRNRFLDNRLQFNLEGFYWKYRNKQERFLGATPSGTTGLLTTNAGRATLYGASADLVFKPTPADTFHASVEYLHTKYDSFIYQVYNPSTNPAVLNSYPAQATTCRIGPVQAFTANDFIPALRGDSTQSVDCSGKPLVRAPKWTGSVSYEHVFDLGGGTTLTPGADGQFSSAQYLSPDFISSGRDNGYFTVNADLTLRLRNGLSLQGWVRNLTRQAIYTGGFRYPFSRAVADGGDPTLFYANIRPPRTYGVSAAFNF